MQDVTQRRRRVFGPAQDTLRAEMGLLELDEELARMLKEQLAEKTDELDRKRREDKLETMNLEDAHAGSYSESESTSEGASVRAP